MATAVVEVATVPFQAMDCPAVWEEPHLDLHPEARGPQAYNLALLQDYDPVRAFPEDSELSFLA
jgi:hypothetical protein